MRKGFFRILKKATASSLILVCTSIGTAFGSGLFVEPAVTYESLASSQQYPAPFSDSSGTTKGFGLGARLGFHLADVFFVGLDGRYSAPQYRESSVAYDANSTSSNWGPVVGIQTPVLGLRVWGSYILGGMLDPNENQGYNIKFSSAKGYRIGVGFKFILVSLNLEYQELKYGSFTLEQIGPFNPGSDLSSLSPTSKGLIASISFPFGL